MDTNVVYNATVTIIGVAILLIHAINIVLKKDRRKDENALLAFISFTIIHFATYFAFVIYKSQNETSDTYIMSFYTVFYVMNNIEMLLFYLYMTSYTKFNAKVKKATDIINLVLFSLFVISDILNLFFHFYFSAENGNYERTSYMIISQGYQFVMLVICLLIAILAKKLNIRERMAFTFYCVIPFISIILQNAFKGWAIAYTTLLFAIEILFLFLNVEKNIKLREEERQLKEANIKIMMSQIQPHFVYNTLSSISTLIPIDQDKAQAALDDFTEYLRMNFATLTETHTVPFEDELKHIKTYVNLEKMRFNGRLKVVYHIDAINFLVPPLSIQPLVENAIKHGVLKKVEGGTVTLRTYADDKHYYVEVSDNGVGFDVDKVDFNNNRHIGLKNVKERIKMMSNGDIKFISKINKGTTVIVRFNK